VIATPHFYANDESVATFVERRAAALDTLKAQLPETAPKILLGAEVRYYQGISRLENLKDLRIEGSKLLLLEMPMSVWTETVIRELIELSGKSGVQIVLAHVERYLKLQKQPVWDRILDSGILMQCNASFFTSLASKRKAISLLTEGVVQFLGSDCHNTTSRPPDLDKAFDVIRKKLGDDYLDQMTQYGYSLFAGTN
jgi:protein-tyrosine phosphatase